ncbi:nitroreductase family protein [bacterium]|nr:nitroreductase family protein [bacterium]
MRKFLSIFATLFVGMGLMFSLCACEPSDSTNMKKVENSTQVKSFYDLSHERYSVRSFSNKPIEEEKLNKILECARVAPTARNDQPQFIYILKTKEALEKAKSVTKSTFEAPIIFIICNDKDR